MLEEYRPFITVSSIGGINEKGNVVAPSILRNEKITSRESKLSVIPQSPQSTSVLFEINMYEQKLFQDTTVESKNPDTNNSFGGIAYIGKTDLYGEQWLYTRPVISYLSEFVDKKVNKAILHMKKFNKNEVPLSGHKIESRFCSFGSTWNNRISNRGCFAKSYSRNDFVSLNITQIVVDLKLGYLIQSDGFIIKSDSIFNEFSALSSGDNFYAPQILEINYK